MDKAQAETVVNNILDKLRNLDVDDEDQVANFKADMITCLVEHGIAQPLEPLVDNEGARELLKNLDHLAGEHMVEAEELIVSALEGGDYTGAIQATGFHQGCRSMREEIRGILNSEFSEGEETG